MGGGGAGPEMSWYAPMSQAPVAGRGFPKMSKLHGFPLIPKLVQRLVRFVPFPIVGEPDISAPVVAFRNVPFGSTLDSKTPPVSGAPDSKAANPPLLKFRKSLPVQLAPVQF